MPRARRVSAPINSRSADTNAKSNFIIAIGMSSKKEATILNAGLTKAISERDCWKASGIQEKYLEAYSLVEVLELQLEQQNGQMCKSKAENSQILTGSANFGEPHPWLSEGG